jgi:hypothetical protein
MTTVEGPLELPAHTPLSVTLPRDGFPNCTSKGNLLNTIENLAYLCRQYDIRLRYNEMSRKLEISIPGETYLVDNRANNALARVESLSAMNGLPRSSVSPFLHYIGAQNSYHPVRNWIESKPWDGVCRLREFYDTLQVAGDYPADFRDTLVKRWLLNGVRWSRQMTNVSLNFPRVFAHVTEELKRHFSLDGHTAQGYCLLAIRRNDDISNDRLVELQAPANALDGWRPRDHGNPEDAAVEGFRAFSAAAWRW